MSAGTIWYKMQPNSEIAAAISDLLTDYCGSVKSHDTTVKPQRIPPLMAGILSRSDAVVIVGGMEAITPEENIVYLMARSLGIPLEEGRHSRSKYVFDTLHGTRLPSLRGAVLFPTRFGGPEGILLMAGQQTVIVLPGLTRAAVTAAVSMRKFLAPYVQMRRSEAFSLQSEEYVPKVYGKFKSSGVRRQSLTREYSEGKLNAVMERTVAYVRRKNGLPTSVSRQTSVGRRKSFDAVDWRRADAEEEEYYDGLAQAGKVRRILLLLAVIGTVTALFTAACLYPEQLERLFSVGRAVKLMLCFCLS